MSHPSVPHEGALPPVPEALEALLVAAAPPVPEAAWLPVLEVVVWPAVLEDAVWPAVLEAAPPVPEVDVVPLEPPQAARGSAQQARA